MEVFIKTLQTLDALGFSPTSIVILGMLYFMGAQSGMFPRFWDTNEEKKGVTIAQLHDEMQHLKSYFNHETTERLDKINVEVSDVKESVKELNRKHEEYEKYGIKVRA